MARSHLVSSQQYPESVQSLQYDSGFAVRGVAFDTKRGNLLKLDHLHAVQEGNAYYGRRRLSLEEVVAAYGSLVVTSAELASFRPLVDLFCLPEACLIADVIQLFSDSGMPFSPGHVYQDVKGAVSHLHESGLLHGAISAEPERFIEESPSVVRLLRKLKAEGKKTFLLTNSGFAFVNAGMNHITRAELAPSEWLSLFDLIVVGADKPTFYAADLPFRSLNAVTGKVRWLPVESLHPGAVYHGGSFAELNRLTGGSFAGQRVLYLGDHVFSDLSKPSRIGWRTGAIIRELAAEVDLQRSPAYKTALAALLATEAALRTAQADGPRDGARMAALRAARAEQREVLKCLFNPHFGSVFRTHSGPTLFSSSVLRYADIYTARFENLFDLASDYTLYPARRPLPHEPRHVGL